MNMLVCIKQVPDTTEIKINPETNTLIRDGVPSIVNPFDAYALECAARVKDKNPGSKIIVATMGPEQAKVALKECLSVGGDKAYLITDRKFGGSDTLATGYTLYKGMKKIEELEGLTFDLIFCGKQAIDGDTAQVGPQMAENLDYPQVTYAYEVFTAEAGKVRVKKETEEGFEILEVATPCMITVTKPNYEPRYPTIKSKMGANKAVIANITTADMPDLDPEQLGLKGSPTKVKKTFTPPRKGGGIVIKEETDQDSAKKLFELMSAKNLV